MHFLSKAFLLLSAVSAVTTLNIGTASARSKHHSSTKQQRTYQRRHVIECVAFIHQATTFQVHGDAKDWWARSAQKKYERGHEPEVGAVMSFRPIGRMVLGHVALVKKLVDSRTILIDHSHWATDGIRRNVRVVDVSPKNNWSKVRVAINDHPELLGSVYPINGFIYPRMHKQPDISEVSAKDIINAKWRKSSDDSDIQYAKKNTTTDTTTLLSSGILENGPYRTL